MNRHEFIDWYEDVRAGTRRLISVVPDEAFDFRATESGPTIEQIIRAFASLERQFIRGVCLGDWSDPASPTDVRRQIRDSMVDEGDAQDFRMSDDIETADDVLEELDRAHDDALDILAELSDEEFMNRVVVLPWGERGTIARLLLGLVEREIHHRTELYMALSLYGVPVTPMMLFGP